MSKEPGTYIELDESWDESGWTQVPNSIARCGTVSRRLKGWILEVASHRKGRRLTIKQMLECSTDGRDATYSTIKEGIESGFVTRHQERGEGGRMGAVVYRIHATAQKPQVTPLTAKPDTADPSTADPSTVNPEGSNKTSKDLKEQTSKPLPTGAGDTADTGLFEAPGSVPSAGRKAGEVDRLFEEFWKTYPRKTDKKKARAAWGKAVKGNDPRELINAAARFARSRDGQDPQFTAHPTTWLNGERWNDEPTYVRRNGQVTGRDVQDMKAAAAMRRAAMNVDGDF